MKSPTRLGSLLRFTVTAGIVVEASQTHVLRITRLTCFAMCPKFGLAETRLSTTRVRFRKIRSCSYRRGPPGPVSKPR
jgi:hypothetical protein